MRLSLAVMLRTIRRGGDQQKDQPRETPRTGVLRLRVVALLFVGLRELNPWQSLGVVLAVDLARGGPAKSKN